MSLMKCSAALVLAVAQVSLAAPTVGTKSYVHTALEGTSFQGNPQTVFSESLYDQHAADANGHSYSALHYPIQPGTIPGSMPSTAAAAYVHAMAQIDVPAGSLHLHDSGWISCGSDSATYGWVQGYAQVGVTDIITLDAPARVTLVGHVSGSTFGTMSGNYNRPDGSISASFGFVHPVVTSGDGVWWELQGYDRSFPISYADTTDTIIGPGMPGPSPAPVYDSISYTWDLPAGNHYFTAALDASFALSVGPGGFTQAALAFENTANFQLYVPEGVTATSQSGLIPISVPEPTSLAWIASATIVLLRRGRR